MMKVTNTGTATRGVYVGGIIKFIKPGETRELALSGFELNDAKTTVGLVIEPLEQPKPAAKPKAAAKTEEKAAEAGATE